MKTYRAGIKRKPSGEHVVRGDMTVLGRLRSEPRRDIPAGNVGFNMYDVLYAQFFGVPNDTALWQYAAECGSRIVRIMYSAFYAVDYTSYVFAAGIPARDYVDSDFRPAFLTKSDSVFNAAHAQGLMLHPTLFWSQNETAIAAGETTATGYAHAATNTAIFMQRFARWFATRYSTHPALYCYSLGNEWVYQESALANPQNYPTVAQLGTVFASVSAAIHEIDPGAQVTADLTIPPVNVNVTRQTLDNAIDCYRVAFRGLDFWTLHTYISGSNYVGRNTYQAGVEPAPSNPYGFEALHTPIRLVAEAAAADGKFLVIGEIGVHTGEEANTAAVKKRRGLLGCTPYARYVMIWNVQPASRADSPQSTWFIEPGTTRANTFKAIVQELNKARGPAEVETSSLSGHRQSGPRFCFTSSRALETKVSLTSFPKMASTRYGFAMWLRVNAALTAFEMIADFRNGTATAGVVVLGSSIPGSWYAEFRRVGGNAGSTADKAPAITVGKWMHLGVVYTPGTQNIIDMYINGVHWSAQVNANALVAIPDATTLYIGGGSGGNGSPLSFQDVALFPSAGPAEIVRHMTGEVLPDSFFHIRAGASGGIADVSRFASSLTVGAAVTTEVLQ